MRNARIMLAAGLLAVMGLAAAGCQGPGSVQHADTEVAAFHQRLDAGNFEAILGDAGPELKADGAKFGQLLTTVHERMGKVRESKRTGWNTSIDTEGSATQVTMNTTFERGTAEETFVFKAASGGKQQLAGYHIKPAGADAE